MNEKKLEIVLASPRGFCAGVDRAILIVENALKKWGPPVYVRHEIVHNRHVVERLQAQGVIFVEEIKDIPKGSHAIFSAHGVSPAVRQQAKEQSLEVVDATCPLVTKVHGEAQRYRRKNFTILLIGHAEHVEVQGTMGEAPERMIVIETIQDAEKVQLPDSNQVAYLTQTTLSLDDTFEIIKILKKRFPSIEGPPKDDICYATQNRQNAVKELASQVERILVVGASNSSNTLRLVEVAKAQGTEARRVEEASQIGKTDVERVGSIGITAGASAPEDVVQSIVAKLCELAPQHIVRELKLVDENVNFALPAILRNA
ncbi:MAG: 4-hydroxy-3-methylbut-2-enyl diphosphate reductase [Deltaproteobacteria bacterium]|nr:4-hydroxy-3-methylbut-2-enyl diphosphate reductase [Deltaproteobacteria bacterium]